MSCCADSSRNTAVIFLAWASIAPTAENAQHDLHLPWNEMELQ